jgi:hypothetical protein
LGIAGAVLSPQDGLYPKTAQLVSLKFLIEPIRLVLTSLSAGLAPIQQGRELALTDSASISPQSRKTPAGNMVMSATTAAPSVRGQR